MAECVEPSRTPLATCVKKNKLVGEPGDLASLKEAASFSSIRLFRT